MLMDADSGTTIVSFSAIQSWAFSPNGKTALTAKQDEGAGWGRRVGQTNPRVSDPCRSDRVGGLWLGWQASAHRGRQVGAALGCGIGAGGIRAFENLAPKQYAGPMTAVHVIDVDGKSLRRVTEGDRCDYLGGNFFDAALLLFR